jgi:hypothetical protein
VGEQINWDDEGREHLLRRPERYPGATPIAPEWTQEVLEDPWLVVIDPDPRSASGAVRLIGYSHGARRVITVVAQHAGRDEWHGVTAYPTSGRDLRDYERRAR